MSLHIDNDKNDYMIVWAVWLESYFKTRTVFWRDAIVRRHVTSAVAFIRVASLDFIITLNSSTTWMLFFRSNSIKSSLATNWSRNRYRPSYRDFWQLLTPVIFFNLSLFSMTFRRFDSCPRTEFHRMHPSLMLISSAHQVVH